MTHPSTAPHASADGLPNPDTNAEFDRACDQLFAGVEAIRPVGAAPDWLLRPDFDWGLPQRSEEFAEGSARKMLMFSSSRYLQALGASGGPDTRLMRTALKQIEDAEALELVCEASRLVRAFAQEWGLPEEMVEALATRYSELAGSIEAASPSQDRSQADHSHRDYPYD